MYGRGPSGQFDALQSPYGGGPMYRSKLANIFGTRMVEAGQPLQSAAAGFLMSQNGQTMMTPRGAVAGVPLQYSPRAPNAPRPMSARPPTGGYSTLGSANVRPQRPMSARDAASARAAARTGSASPREQLDKMKRLMQAAANQKEEVAVDTLQLCAQLANVPISDLQKELYFNTPYANKYAATWNVHSQRNDYGLECQPASIKWRAFDATLCTPKLSKSANVERALKFYADKEKFAIAEQKRKDEEAAALAKARAEALGRPVEASRGVSDDQLRMIHNTVKAKLANQFQDIRSAFRNFDKDSSGCISADECCDALMSLNIGVPRKWVEHLVNVIDYDRDGEINYAEFARLLTADDIVGIKKEGAEDEGLVVKQKDYYKPGMLKSELRSAQQKIHDMLTQRGGLTKMFRAIDEDKSGSLSRQEVRQLVMGLNLENIVRPAVVEELIKLMDVDGDDSITYKEFVRVCTSEDVFNMAELTQMPKQEEKKPPPKKKAMRKRGARF